MFRKGVVRFWSVVTLGLVGLWLTCYGYDEVLGGGDGFISNIAYKNVFKFIFVLHVLVAGLCLGLTARQRTIQNSALLISSGLFFIGLAEGAVHLAIGLNLIKSHSFVFRRFYISPEDARKDLFPVAEIDPILGRWRVPNSTYEFINCEGDSIKWTYNSVGASDRQRSFTKSDPTRKRVSVIGDSFLEGYMVNSDKRVSNLLEDKTGVEHLNFAIRGANPINYYLIYKNRAKAFDSDVLFIGFLPANDFEYYTEKDAYKHIEWPAYMPYWKGTYPNYSLQYSLANVTQAIHYGNHTPKTLLKVVDSVYNTLPLTGKLKADLLAHSSVFRVLGIVNGKSYGNEKFTRFEQFTTDEWNIATYSLVKLIEEARGKKIILLSIPILGDLKALKQGGTNKIDPQLDAFCRQYGIGFIPLTPSFLNYKGNPEHLYVPCDGHWSVQGEAYAADVIINHPIYRSAIGLP